MFWISSGHTVSIDGFSFIDEVVFDQLLFEICEISNVEFDILPYNSALLSAHI